MNQDEEDRQAAQTDRLFAKRGYFVDCICEHDPELHEVERCTVKDCACPGGWQR